MMGIYPIPFLQKNLFCQPQTQFFDIFNLFLTIS